jgi:hypothetical protein
MPRPARHPDGVLGCADETWWGRLAHPPPHTRTAQRPLRPAERALAQGDPDPKALCGSGVRRTDRAHTRLRLVEGRPVRHVTTAFRAWPVPQMAAEHKRVLALIWDDASWPSSRGARTGIRQHHHQAKRHGAVWLLTCRLPVRSPWLTPLEPRWVHGTRAAVEPARLLTAPELMSRVCAYFATAQLEPLQQHVA